MGAGLEGRRVNLRGFISLLCHKLLEPAGGAGGSA